MLLYSVVQFQTGDCGPIVLDTAPLKGDGDGDGEDDTGPGQRMMDRVGGTGIGAIWDKQKIRLIMHSLGLHAYNFLGLGTFSSQNLENVHKREAENTILNTKSQTHLFSC